MGGYGSGIQRSGCAKRTVENSRILDINVIARDRYRQGSLTWMREDQAMGSIGYCLYDKTLDLFYVVSRQGMNDQALRDTFNLVETRPFFGGRRKWMLCPGCNRRVAKLYLPAKERFFRCRRCHNLTYRSCQESHSFRDISLLKFFRWVRRGSEQVKNEKESGVRVVPVSELKSENGNAM